MTATVAPAKHERSAVDATVDDASLVARVADGDRGAFEVLYKRHHTPLFRTALALTRDRGTAEELLQEAFLRAYRHMGRVELAPDASLRPWLHRILINLTYDWSARQKTAAGSFDRVVERLSPSPGLTPEGRAEQREIQRVVADAIAELPFKQRAVVVLFYLHDMDLHEIAATLNVPPGTVKSRLYYGRARLRKRLEADSRLPASAVMRYVSA
ncbi:MAG: RNA polymerase sigma factor [Anaerolineae bacterium]